MTPALYPVFLKLDAETFGATAMDSGHQSFHDPARPQVETRDTGEDPRIEIIFIAVDHETDSFFTTTAYDNLASSALRIAASHGS